MPPVCQTAIEEMFSEPWTWDVAILRRFDGHIECRWSDKCVGFADMIEFLFGSDSARTVHLHVVTNRADAVPWRTGVFFVRTGESDLLLVADEDTLGKGELQISTISFIETEERERPVYAPERPMGERNPDPVEFLLQADQIGTVVDLTMTTTLLSPHARFSVADGSRLKLYVDTWTMGRGNPDVDSLECIGTSRSSTR